MKLRSLSVRFALLLMLSPAAAFNALGQACERADAVAISWLDKMSHSIRRYDYHGVITLRRGDDMEVLQVSHLVSRGASSERLTQLTGQGARVYRKAHPLDCVHPGHRLLRVSEGLKSGDCGLAQHYHFRVEGTERVAGRPAVRMVVEPRDMYRYGFRLALDRETGLLLKTETYGRGGKVLETFQYANLTYGEDAPGLSDVETIHEASHPHPGHPQGRAVISPWKVNWLPQGFELTDATGGVTGRQSYTDGLAVFSVFVEEFDREIRAGEGVIREGGTTSYTRGLTLGERPVLITVIGEVPVNTARMVADSVAWAQ